MQGRAAILKGRDRPKGSIIRESPSTASDGTASRSAAKTAIITVSYRSAADLRRLLETVPAACSEPTVGVIADNHPDDDVRRIAVEAGWAYVPLENRGYGTAVNRSVAGLDPDVEWVLVVNPDVRFEPEALDVLLMRGRSDERIAAIGPRILDGNGSVYPSARAVPSLRTGIGHALLGRLWPSNPWTSRYLRFSALEQAKTMPTGWLSGACVLVRRSAFEAIGGFDEGYFMYFEDVDLGFRLGRAGFLNVYEPSAVVQHIGGTSTQQLSEQMSRAHHESALRFIRQKYSGPVLAPLRVALRLGLTLRERAMRAHSHTK